MCASKVVLALGVIAIVLATSVSSADAEASLFLQNGVAPAWSPDGTSIACTRPTSTWSDAPACKGS